MGVRLELSKDGTVVLWRQVDRDLFSVGSNPECDLCIPDPSVAPIQLLLRLDREGLFLLNRHGEGTSVGDTVVSDELKMAGGDRIRLGGVTATVHFVDGQSRGVSKTRTLAEPGAPQGARLLVSAPEALPGRVWVLGSEGVNIGSDPKNDVVLDDRYVSSFHAQVFVQEGRCFIRDLDSRNGVFIADQKVREAQVPVGSQVRVGKSVLLIATEDAGLTANHEPPRPGTALIGNSPAMDKLRALLRRVAQHDAPVLITGETGTGKEVVAQSLVELSPRAHRSYVALNCGALGRNLIESELFGHEKGAFTGAVARKAGAFELADRGTLFLDEIGELPLDLQPQLLRVVEYNEVRRVGGDDTFRVDVRLIAATNRRLEVEVAAGTFREDLYHRLHVLRIEIPPLRERREDIPVLTRHFIDQACPEGTSLEITPKALDVINGHTWPGNVRELRNVMQRAVLMRAADRIDVEDITFTPSTLAHRVEAASAKSGRTLAEIEREAIISELARQRGNKKEAAAALGVSRSTIHRKIDEYGIDVDGLG